MIHLLPEDITLQILLLLPLYSLLSCKCVSKQWKSLITSPNFFKLYNKPNSIFFYLDHCAALKCIFIPDDTDVKEDIGTPRRIRKLTTPQFLLHSSTSKILCFKEHAPGLKFIVYNLLTGAMITAPMPDKVRWVNKEWYHNVCYGFGYNPCEDDYNLVWLVLDKLNSFCNEMHIYSLRNRAWKSFYDAFDTTNTYYWKRTSTFAYGFNGALYWVVDLQGPEHPDDHLDYKVIVALDMHTRTLSEMELPRGYKKHQPLPTFSELDGQLCCFIHDESHFDVWGMTKKSCWSKLLRILKEPTYVFQQIPNWYDSMVYRFGQRVALCVHRWSNARVILCNSCRPTLTQYLKFY